MYVRCFLILYPFLNVYSGFVGFLPTGNAAALPSIRCAVHSRGFARDAGCGVRAYTTGNSQGKPSSCPPTSAMPQRGRPPACRGGDSRSSCDRFRWGTRDPEAKRGVPLGRSRASRAVCMLQLYCHCQVSAFAPSSVLTFFYQEVLSLDCLATLKLAALCFHHIHLELAHAIMAKACFGIFLHLDDSMDKKTIEGCPHRWRILRQLHRSWRCVIIEKESIISLTLAGHVSTQGSGC